MHARITSLVVFALLALACRYPQPATVGRKLIDCSVDSVKKRALTEIDTVNSVLADTGVDDEGARFRLVNLAVDIGQDVLSCILRDQGVKFGEAARVNPRDRISVTAARRADSYLRDNEITFKDEYRSP
jgi:hypothetical protein